MKTFSDLEQSKILSEFLPCESADMWWPWYSNLLSDGYYDDFPMFYKPICNPEKSIPCWSLDALLNLLPSKFTEKGKYSETTYSIHIRKYALTEDVDVYQIAYGNYKFYEDGHSSWKDMINTGEKENLIDAVFQMIIWLNENNKL